ncbi:MAG: F0F1 ATP synthase subunit B [Acutalibacteraceae bacterium]|nr:F0F1 ATP synthase subunit B [Acutalibacteraceae bacterium]
MEGLVLSDAVKDLIINIINIVILFVIVRGLAYKPVKKFLDARKERIAKELSEAAEAKQTAEEEALKYKELTEKSKAQGTEIINEAERTAKENAAEIIETARQKAAEITEKARENAKKERETQIAAMKGDITDIAFDISRQVLSREVTDEDNMRIADAFFAKYQG